MSMSAETRWLLATLPSATYRWSRTMVQFPRASRLPAHRGRPARLHQRAHAGVLEGARLS
jgi:hypothetical protein